MVPARGLRCPIQFASVRTPTMVPVLFMPAVMAAEQIGGGREELEDFDEAADGEPVLMADA